MKTRDAADGSPANERPANDSPAETELRLALHRLVDAVPPTAEPLSGVFRKVARLRRRRRTARTVGAAAVLALGTGFAPSLIAEIEAMGAPHQKLASPPSAVLELPGAYPVQAPVRAAMNATPSDDLVPANVLGWPSRGQSAPGQVLTTAEAFLVDQARKSGAADPLTAEVHQLWAHQEAAGKPAWAFVGEGWTSGPDGLSEGFIVYVEWDGSQGPSTAAGAVVFPTRFLHPEPGSAADPAAVDRISEISFSTQSGGMLVIGAPQVKTVLYSASGGKDYVAEKTVDGVAMFTRAPRPSQGLFADEVQVRDAHNAALTPPGGWAAGDYNLATAVWFKAPAVQPSAPRSSATKWPPPRNPSPRPTPPPLTALRLK